MAMNILVFAFAFVMPAVSHIIRLKSGDVCSMTLCNLSEICASELRLPSCMCLQMLRCMSVENISKDFDVRAYLFIKPQNYLDKTIAITLPAT